METVWIRLKVVDRKQIPTEQTLMFGTGGVISFKTVEGRTMLTSVGCAMIEVEEHADVIFEALKKIRGSEGKHSKNVTSEKEKTIKRKSSPSKR